MSTTYDARCDYDALTDAQRIALASLVVLFNGRTIMPKAELGDYDPKHYSGQRNKRHARQKAHMLHVLRRDGWYFEQGANIVTSRKLDRLIAAKGSPVVSLKAVA